MKSHAQDAKRMLPRKWIAAILDAADNVAVLFVKLKISPNMLSVLALLLGLGAGIFFAAGQPVWATVMIFFCGLFDILDGKVAIQTDRTSLFGAIFDSTLDRYSEFFIYFGLAYYFKEHWALWILFWTFLGSTMVSYTRARAEGLGIDCKVGFMQRAERMILLSLGSVVGSLFNIFDQVIIGVLIFITLVSNFTALQRTFYVKKMEKHQDK
jgi:CDP-diacylglycerol--glycerol-3-phosphate 3-phosphatidyltransferase